MRRIVFTYGIIAGLIVAAWLFISLVIYKDIDFENGMWYGYASMLLAFSLIFVAVKNFRDKFNKGQISFGKAFKIGLYISLVASTIYVVSWLIDYYFFIPDFMEKYTAATIEKLRTQGTSQAEINRQLAEMNKFNEMYKNPLFNALISYAEILPVGLIVSAISGLILKKKAG